MARTEVHITSNTQDSYASKLDEINSVATKGGNIIVNCTDSDFYNLLYLFLILQRNSTKCHLHISLNCKSKNEKQELMGKLSAFLSIVSSEFLLPPTKFIGEKYNLFNVKKRSLQKLLPLLPINQDVYQFLSDFVKSTFQLDNTRRKLKVVVDSDGRVYLDKPRAKSNEITNAIHNICSNYMFIYSGKSALPKEMKDSLIDFFMSETFFEMVQHISVLALLIFLVQYKTQVEERHELLKKIRLEKSKTKYCVDDFGSKFIDDSFYDDLRPHISDNMQGMIINAMDMADGINQLIENIVFHAGYDDDKQGVGFLYLRVHSNEAGYLRNQYNYYFKGYDNRTKLIFNEENNEYQETKSEYSILSQTMHDIGSTLSIIEQQHNVTEISSIIEETATRQKKRENIRHLLEVRLSDYSGKNMCSVFYQKMKDRKQFDLAEKYESIKTVKSFFSPSKDEYEFWQEYFNVPENVIHHYGLQLFYELLSSNDGCMIAQSMGSGDQLPLENSAFTTSGDSLLSTNLSPTVDDFFPGTHFAFLIPFITQQQRGYSYINTQIDYRISDDIIEKTKTYDKDDEAIGRYIKELKKPTKAASQEEKETRIANLYRILDDRSTQMQFPNFSVDYKYLFYHFDADEVEFGTRSLEIFAKSIMSLIANRSDTELRIALSNCNSSVMISIIRMFSVFYDRNGENGLLEKVQLYLCGQDSRDEFTLIGKNLRASLTAQLKLSVARGSSKQVSDFLVRMLERRTVTSDNKFKAADDASIFATSLFPFDILVKNKSGRTVFEQNVDKVLHNSVQGIAPGYEISPTHMRLGSKIHIDKFYEAEPLFYNSYYTKRFAWLLFHQIKDEVLNNRQGEDGGNKPVLLVGYNTYSEMLIRELMLLINSLDLTVDYRIYEYLGNGNRGVFDNDEQNAKNLNGDEQRYLDNSDKGVFRPTIDISLGDDYRIIYVVPIASTLSTFSKLEAEWNVFNERSRRQSNKNVPLYLCVLHAGEIDSGLNIHRDYYEDNEVNGKRIISRLLPEQSADDGSQPIRFVNYRSVDFLMKVSSLWEHPLVCKQCFPDCLFAEQPLVETDKTSVVPIQLYGLKESRYSRINKPDPRTSPSIQNSRFHLLENNLTYQHCFRGSNHFEYYFHTDSLFAEADSDGSLVEWLHTVKNDIHSRQIISKPHYDIIVYPVHFSNASFVQKVNEEVFQGSAHVIGVDSDSEYRDNFKAKNSDLTSLYRNWKDEHRYADIDFHFVDDTIVQGQTINRVKSLVSSLFSDPPMDNEVTVFKSIILLVNRNSRDSIANYIDLQDFYSFINLDVSSMRSHGDACVLCQELAIYRDLANSSSSIITENYFRKEIENYELRKIDESSQPNNDIKNKQGFYRLEQSQILQEKTKSLGDDSNNKQKVLYIIVELMHNILRNDADDFKLDRFLALLHVSSSPFISFRKSSREAILDIILLIFEIILCNKNVSDILDDLSNELSSDKMLSYYSSDSGGTRSEEKREILASKGVIDILLLLKGIANSNFEFRQSLLEELIDSSVRLKSNYIIRKENILKIIKALINRPHEMHQENQVQPDHYDYLDHYLGSIVRLIYSSSDEMKSLWLEYLLVYGNECSDYDQNTWEEPNLHLDFTMKILNGIAENEIINFYNTESNKAMLEHFLEHLYLENTKIISETLRDLNSPNLEIDDPSAYYYRNFILFIKLNTMVLNQGYEDLQLNNDAIDNSIKLASSLKNVNDYLHSIMGDTTESVVARYENLSKLLEKLMTEAYMSPIPLDALNLNTDDNRLGVYFICEQDEIFLDFDISEVKNPMGARVYKKKGYIYKCFSRSAGTSDLFPKKKIFNLEPVDFIKINRGLEKDGYLDLSSFTISNNSSVDPMSDETEKSLENMYLLNLQPASENEKAVHILIHFPSYFDKHDRLRVIRYLLVFRTRLSSLIARDFRNNLLSEWLHDEDIKDQLKKARAGYHDSEHKETDPMKRAKRIFFFTEEEEIDNNNFDIKHALFGALMNTAIGRLNIKLLSSNDELGAPTADYDFDIFMHVLASLINLPVFQLGLKLYINNQLVDVNDISSFENIILSQFHGIKLRVFEEGSDLKTELTHYCAVLAELITSVYLNGNLPEKQREARIDIDVNNGMIWVSNRVRESTAIKNIQQGVRRSGQGISLATICGFFIRLIAESNNKKCNGKEICQMASDKCSGCDALVRIHFEENVIVRGSGEDDYKVSIGLPMLVKG